MKLSFTEREEKRRTAELLLLKNLRAEKQSLENLLASCNDHWGYEDPIYRFYHQSFKVFFLQESTKSIVSALRALLPEQPINEWFEKIVNNGLGQVLRTRPMKIGLPKYAPFSKHFFTPNIFSRWQSVTPENSKSRLPLCRAGGRVSYTSMGYVNQSTKFDTN